MDKEMTITNDFVARISAVLSWTRRVLIPVLLLALCLMVARTYGTAVLVFGGGFLAAMIVLPVGFYRGVLEPLFRGVQCPTCREWSLKRVAVLSFGYRFYRCDSCGQRCKRTDHESPWIDASAMQDDDMYKAIPHYGADRKREASIAALKSLGGLAALFLFGALGRLVYGEKGLVVGVMIGTLLLFRIAESDTKGQKILPIRPVLWDQQVDHTADR
jgi:hypothetical protein